MSQVLQSFLLVVAILINCYHRVHFQTSNEHKFWFDLDKCQVPTKTVLSLHLLSWTGERKCDERLKGRDKDSERSLTNYCHGQNRLNLGTKGKFSL